MNWLRTVLPTTFENFASSDAKLYGKKGRRNKEEKDKNRKHDRLRTEYNRHLGTEGRSASEDALTEGEG